VPQNAPVVLLEKPSITVSGDKAYIRLKFSLRYDLLCSKTPLETLSAQGNEIACGTDEKEVVYWGSNVRGLLALLPDYYMGGYVAVFLDGKVVYEKSSTYEIVEDVFLPWADSAGDRTIKRKVKIQVCNGSATLRLYAQDCPQKVPVDIEVWAGGRLLYGVSTTLDTSRLTEERTIAVPANYAAYEVKLYSGWKYTTPNCRDLLLSFVVENPSVKTEPGLKINAVYVGGQKVPDGGKISTSVPVEIAVEFQSDASRDVQVVMYWVNSTTPVVIWSGSASGTMKATTTMMVPKTGDYTIKFYAVSGSAKSNEYTITVSVTSVPECPEGSQLVKGSGECYLPDGTKGTCVKQYGEYCCCKVAERAPKFRLEVPTTVTVLYGEKKTIFVDVYNDGTAYGTATVEVSGKSINAKYSVAVWPGSRNSIKFEVEPTENDTITVKAYYGGTLHDSKTIYLYVIKRTTIDFTFKVDKTKVCYKKDLVTVTVSVNYTYPTTAFVYILNANKQTLLFRSFTAPGPVDITFLPPEMGRQKFYVAVKLGDGYNEKEFELDVVGCPNFSLDKPVVEYMKPCASGLVEAGFGVWVVNDGWGQGTAKVVFEVGSCQTPCTPDKFVAECPAGCPEVAVTLEPFTNKYVTAKMMTLGCGRTYYLRARAVYDSQQTVSDVVSFTTPKEKTEDGGTGGCICVPKNMCSKYEQTCTLPNGEEGVCCLQQPCSLTISTRVEGNTVYATVTGATGDVTLYLSKEGGNYLTLKYAGPDMAIPLGDGIWRIEARDSNGCYGQTIVVVGRRETTTGGGGGITIIGGGGGGAGGESLNRLESVTQFLVELIPVLLLLNIVSLFSD